MFSIVMGIIINAPNPSSGMRRLNIKLSSVDRILNIKNIKLRVDQTLLNALFVYDLSAKTFV